MQYCNYDNKKKDKNRILDFDSDLINLLVLIKIYYDILKLFTFYTLYISYKLYKYNELAVSV